ncbi:MAG: metal-dependent hydrolase [Nitrospirales bacterium]
MASAFGHVAVAYAMGKTLNSGLASPRFWVWTVVCCLLPDADVVGLVAGIPYEHLWGHRGMTHSITFAVLVGMAVPALAAPNSPWGSRRYGVLVIYFSLVTLSHAFLDAFTNGGLGIAFFAPFDTTRYFFPWTPIEVSPLGFTQFFSSWGLGVLLSELVWIGVPVGVWLLGQRVVRRQGVNKSR